MFWRKKILLPGVHPISNDFGEARGGAVDRYYIEKFLKENRSFIQGHVLEIGSDYYTRLYGTDITVADVLNVIEGTPGTTILADLNNETEIPSETFDCIIFTQTLQLIYDFNCALATCSRILKPGGVFLMTCPGISQVGPGIWKNTWHYSFTEISITKIVSKHFENFEYKTQSFGNVMIASALLYGLGMDDVSIKQLDVKDDNYPVIITTYAKKPG